MRQWGDRARAVLEGMQIERWGKGFSELDAQRTYRVLLDLAVRTRSKRTTLTTNRSVSVGREAAAEARAAQRTSLTGTPVDVKSPDEGGRVRRATKYLVAIMLYFDWTIKALRTAARDSGPTSRSGG